MNCSEFKTLTGSYLDDELMVETNHAMQKHLEGCPDCRTLTAATRNLRVRLRLAVLNDSESNIGKDFQGTLAQKLEREALQNKLSGRLSTIFGLSRLRLAGAAAFCLLIALTAGIFWSGVLNNDDLYVFSTRGPSHDLDLAAISRQAIGDHENCAVKFNLKERPIDLDEAAKNYGAFLKDIDKMAVTALNAQTSPDNFELLEAHSCVFDGRRFTHVVLRQGGELVSVLVTDAAGTGKAEKSVERFSEGRMNAAAFGVAGHAVFVVSAFNANANADIAGRLYPAFANRLAAA